MSEIVFANELDALPDGSLIWYWITHDGAEIHQILQKHGDWWRNTHDPDDDFNYQPILHKGPITLLRRGWPT